MLYPYGTIVTHKNIIENDIPLKAIIAPCLDMVELNVSGWVDLVFPPDSDFERGRILENNIAKYYNVPAIEPED